MYTRSEIYGTAMKRPLRVRMREFEERGSSNEIRSRKQSTRSSKSWNKQPSEIDFVASDDSPRGSTSPDQWKRRRREKKNDSSLDSLSVLLWKINPYTQGREEEGKDRRVATERRMGERVKARAFYRFDVCLRSSSPLFNLAAAQLSAVALLLSYSRRPSPPPPLSIRINIAARFAPIIRPAPNFS